MSHHQCRLSEDLYDLDGGIIRRVFIKTKRQLDDGCSVATSSG